MLKFLWTLYKFDGETETTEMGLYQLPLDDLGNGLDSEWIVLNLNTESCFDFDYQPKEGDSLRIHQNVVHSPYLSFICIENKWVVGHHDPWSTDISQMMNGVVNAVE